MALGVPRARFRTSTWVMWIVAVAIVAFFPTTYFVLAPGTAVDLSERVVVAGHAPATDHYYLTDVSLRRASIAMLLARFVPGDRVVPQSTIVPAGITPKSFDAILVRAMDSSQDIAAIVAERAAGLPVHVPETNLVIANIAPSSHARGVVEVGDVLASAGGVAVHDTRALVHVLQIAPAGAPVTLVVKRRGRIVSVAIATVELNGRRRLGVALLPSRPRAVLPVKVTYTMGDVAGSSGGLMFALAIYASLHESAARARAPLPSAIAGTGTLDLDGTVGEIEGTQQKLIAAKRAGATIFLVPRENYVDIKGDPDIRIIPVGSFKEAVAALQRAGIGA